MEYLPAQTSSEVGVEVMDLQEWEVGVEAMDLQELEVVVVVEEHQA